MIKTEWKISLKDCIEEYLKGNYEYCYEEEKEEFCVFRNYATAIRHWKARISIEEDGFTMYDIFPVAPEKDKSASIVSLLDYIKKKEKVVSGELYLEAETGCIMYRQHYNCIDSKLPGKKELEEIFYNMIWLIVLFEEHLLAVLFGKYTVEEACKLIDVLEQEG